MYAILVSTSIVQAVNKKGILMSHCTVKCRALCFILAPVSDSLKIKGFSSGGNEGSSCLLPTNLYIYMNSYPESVMALQ